MENATGLGYLLAQQLVAAGERVFDVQPKLAARVRLLANESTNKNDPHDARSVAIAALRSNKAKLVHAEDRAAVAKLWARRQRALIRLASSRSSRGEQARQSHRRHFGCADLAGVSSQEAVSRTLARICNETP